MPTCSCRQMASRRRRRRGGRAGPRSGTAINGQPRAAARSPQARESGIVGPVHVGGRHPVPAVAQMRRRLQDGRFGPAAAAADDANVEDGRRSGRRRPGCRAGVEHGRVIRLPLRSCVAVAPRSRAMMASNVRAFAAHDSSSRRRRAWRCPAGTPSRARSRARARERLGASRRRRRRRPTRASPAGRGPRPACPSPGTP